MKFEPIAENNRVRINLSEVAYLIINDDMHLFNIDSRSTFVNTVLHNHYENSKASIDLYLNRKKDELIEILQQNDPLSEETNNFINKLLKREEQKLTAEISSLLKKKYKSEIYYINNENYEDLMEESSDTSYSCYKTFSQYLKCILEDYASYPYKDREYIFYQEKYNTAAYAIDNEILLEVTTQNNKTYKVWPLSLESDPLSTRLYLVGMAKDTDNKIKQKYPVSFRIPKLKKIKTVLTRKNGKKVNKKGKLTKKERDELIKAISKRKVQFLLGQELEIKVRLTDVGIKKYRSYIHLRPDFDPQKSKDHEYVFLCTELQAKSYFFKFGEDAEIISPSHLRNDFREMYKNASLIYNDK